MITWERIARAAARAGWKPVPPTLLDRLRASLAREPDTTPWLLGYRCSCGHVEERRVPKHERVLIRPFRNLAARAHLRDACPFADGVVEEIDRAAP